MIKNLSCPSPTPAVTVTLPQYRGHSSYFTGTTVRSLPVAPGTMGDITSLLEVGTGEVYYSLNGVAPTTTMGADKGRVAGAVALVIKDIDLSLVRLMGTATASAYTVAYRVRL